MSIKPATDEQVARFKVLTVLGSLGSEEELSLIARIEADRARIKRCHAIMQGMHSAIDPDRHSILLADAEKELSGEFCDGACTTACDTRAEADREEIARLKAENDTLKAEVERLSTTCHSCGASGDKPCTDALGYERNRPHPSRGTGRAR